MIYGRYISYILIFFFVFSNVATAKSIAEDRRANNEAKKQCNEIKTYLIKDLYDVECNFGYQHFNSSAYKDHFTRSRRKVKIAGYNLLKPGLVLFKDYALTAKVINKWDVVAGLELSPIRGDDLDNNRNIFKLLVENVEKIKDLTDRLKSLSRKAHQDATNKIKLLEKDLKLAPSLYRGPGYLKILKELRKLDPSWSLLLAPRAEFANSPRASELTGFYYRSKVVKPKMNPHCKEFIKVLGGKHYACIPNFREEFMGRDTTKVFARRPFMSSFQSGSFDFTLIGTHVIYSAPDEVGKIKQIMYPSYGVNHYSEIGDSKVNERTFARFAEVKVTLEFMQKYRESYREQDVILVGDLNLETSRFFLDDISRTFPGGQLLIDNKTSLSRRRFDQVGRPTNGFTSNYDHFVMDDKKTNECLSSKGTFEAKALSYYEGDIKEHISSKYLIRNVSTLTFKNMNEAISGPTQYTMTSAGRRKMNLRLSELEKKLRTIKTIKRGKIVLDTLKIEETLKEYKSRVFMTQLYDKTFYRVFSQVLSDHVPVYISCKTSLRDDD